MLLTGSACRGRTHAEDPGGDNAAGASALPHETTALVPPSSSTRSASAATPAPRSSGLRSLSFVAGGGHRDRTLPWLIALHGLGDTPEGFSDLMQTVDVPAYVDVLAAPLSRGAGLDWFGVRVQGDQEALATAVSSAVALVVQFIEAHEADSAHAALPVVTGFSQGGILSFALAAQRPDKVRAALPIGGMLPRKLWPTAVPKVPIVAFHGQADAIVPFEPTRALVQHLQSLGANVRLEAEPGLGHQLSPSLHAAWLASLRSSLTVPAP